MSLIFSLFIGAVLVALVNSKVVPEIRCTPQSLDVRVSKEGVRSVELEKWSVVPGCQTQDEPEAFLIRLKLSPDLPCGTTRIKNKLTEEALFYHKLSIVDSEGARHLYKVSCFVSQAKGLQSNIVKRNVLPPGFVEPDFIEITSEVTGVAPIPELSVGVRQNGNLIGDQITVSPGAPLIMEVFLDNESSSIYGILVSYMMVTDNSNKNETIIFNGCTQDHYVFENFKTNDGDFLTAKFRAFKFPESNYLLFRGTVDVCLDKCQGIQCSNGEIGYGRRRRSIPQGSDPNKIFEVTMMTFIKVIEEQASPKDSPFIRRGVEKPQNLPRLTYEIEEESSLMTRAANPRDDPAPPPPFVLFETSSAPSLMVPVVLLSLLIPSLVVLMS